VIKMPLAENDNVIMVLSPDRSDQLTATPFCQRNRAEIGRSRISIAVTGQMKALS